YGKKTTKAAVWTSFVLGIVLTMGHMCIFTFFKDACAPVVKWAASLPLNLASPINAGALLMILSIVLTPIISSFTKPCDKEVVENAFSAYNK
ncbi:MAG: sodium:solute symporter, partial [Oscillospiraceae bacterium]|nr:sodium:solute symporter [Oscillospiraceae bacterium]